MSATLRAMIGVLTTLVFVYIGAMLWSGDQTVLGGFLIILGLVRGGVVAMQIRNLLTPDEDEDEDVEDD